MKDRLSRCVLLPGAAVLVAFVLAGGAGAAVRTDLRPGAAGTALDGTYSVNLPAYMLGTVDLPAGFQPYAPLEGGRAKALVASAGQGMISLVHAYVRDWVSP